MRGVPRAPGNLEPPCFIGGNIEQSGAALDNARKFLGCVELQTRDDAEAIPQRVGQHASARRGADQGKGLQIKLDGARRRSFADHDVDLVVFQGRVQDFFHHRTEAVNFVDEKNVVLFQVGQQGREVFGLFQNRPAGLAQIDAEFVRDDVRQGGLAQAWRAKQQHVVKRFTAHLGRADEDLKLLTYLDLPDVLVKHLGPQRALYRLFVGRSRSR